MLSIVVPAPMDSGPVPSAELLPMFRVPADKSVPPEYVFAVPIVTTPPPLMVTVVGIRPSTIAPLPTTLYAKLELLNVTEWAPRLQRC